MWIVFVINDCKLYIYFIGIVNENWESVLLKNELYSELNLV